MRIFYSLRRAAMALLWVGLSFSALGDQLYAVALAWIAVEILGADAGYLAALQACVALVATLCLGRRADRWDRRSSMIGSDIARAAMLAATVAIWLTSGGPGAAPLAITITVLAIGQAVFQPALQSVLPSVVADKRLLLAANGLLDATDRSARLLGPGLVATLAGTVPMVDFLSLDALSFLVSAIAIWLIGRRHRDLPIIRRSDRETIWRGIRRGVQAMAGHPLLGYLLAVSGLLNGTWYAVFYLALPLMIAHEGEAGSGLGAYGLVLSTYGCTNLASTLFSAGGRCRAGRSNRSSPATV